MSSRRTYQIKEVAHMAGVSVRTLHHYDEIGLLVPKLRTAGGYRLYDDSDLMRLQQILIGRELGLSLREIGCSLDDPQFDLRQALRAQREQLHERAQQTEAMLRAIDAALAHLNSISSGGTMDLSQLFDGFDPSKYAEEAKQRWGNTEAYKESRRRASRYTPADWHKLKAEQTAIYESAAAAMRADRRPDEPDVMNIADQHRLLIDRWFYPCTTSMHCGLANLWEADSRFAQNIDKYGQGLTGFLAAAIRANAQRGPHSAR
jgi:MerR family transcriptional regulator, thiopeptide resistance regulator